MTVEDAVRLARSSMELSSLLDARKDSARAKERQAAAFSNPEISWEREQMHFEGKVESENAVSISKEFVVSGRRRLLLESARLNTRGEEELSTKLLMDLEIEVRRAFFTAVHDQEMVELLHGVHAEMLEGLKRLEHRHREGEIPEFDLLRFRTESTRAHADLLQARVAAKESRLVLASLIAPGDERRDSWFLLQAELLPRQPVNPSGPSGDTVSPKNLPEIRALDSLAEASSLDARAAAKKALPNLSLTAGYKTSKGEAGRGHGFLVGVDLPLPFFDNGSHEEALHLAKKRELQSRRTLLLAGARARLEALEARAAILSEAAAELRQEAEGSGGNMMEAARASYEEGAISVVELIDAFASHARTQAEALTLSLEARLAEEELLCLTKGVSR